MSIGGNACDGIFKNYNINKNSYKTKKNNGFFVFFIILSLTEVILVDRGRENMQLPRHKNNTQS